MEQERIPEAIATEKSTSGRMIAALLGGVLVGALLSFFVLDVRSAITAAPDDLQALYESASDEVHVHSDFIVWLDGDQIDLSADRFMSVSDQILHQSIHLHDNDDDVLHRHAEDITLAQFFTSLGFSLTDTCLTTDTGTEYCSDDTQELILFVNGERYEDPSKYVNQDEDRFLLYYGDPSATETITELQSEITDEACIFSYTCPERGTPPPESCGLTCEL